MSAPQDPTFQAPPPPSMPEGEPVGSRAAELRPFAIAAFVLGVIFLGGGLAKFLPGGIGTGAILCILGILWFALSFIRRPPLADSERPLPWFEKITGVFYEPARVFRNLRVHPYWLGALLTIWVLTQIYSIAFIQRITPERIVDHTVEKLSQIGPPFAPPPDALDKIRTDQLEALKNPVQRVGTAFRSLVGIFVLGAIGAGISLLLLLVFGGRANFWQVLAVTFYATVPIVAIQKLLGLVILYLKSPDDLHPILNAETTLQDNLGILLSPANHPILFVIASFIGITSFYGLWLRAKGLHYGCTKVSKGAGWGVSICLWLILLLFATILTALFPGFIS